MPSHQQQFEGPVLEDLLEEIQERYGRGAEIVEANKVRRGGVAGFFAREVFQVTVELPDDHRPTTMLDLVDAVHDEHVVAAERRDRTPRATPTARPRNRVETRDEELARQGHEALLDLRSAVQAERRRIAASEGAAAPVAPRAAVADAVTLSTERSGFAELLASITDQVAPGPATTEAPAEAEDVDEPFQPLRPTAAETPGASVVPHHAAAVEPAPAPAPSVAVEPAATPAPSAAVEPVSSVTPALDRLTAVLERRQAACGVSTPPSVFASSPIASSPIASPLTTRRTRTSLGHDQLRQLGLPSDLVRRVLLPGRDRLGSLLQLAANFPVAAPLPDGPGHVIALVGDRSAIGQAAVHIFDAVGLDPDATVIATREDLDLTPDLLVRDLDDARRGRARWLRRDHPTLVVIDEPVTRLRSSWARNVMAALEPSSIWGVVDATRKPEDIVDWAEGLGGIDALAVTNLDETSSPAAVLTTGIPVSLLDGKPANASRWAVLLDERLDAAA